MDSMDLEREKGITILAKNTAVRYGGDEDQHRRHARATPTSAARSSAALTMVDGVLLLVDASEGPLPQTRFVLRKALEARLPVILVVNKVDRPDARIEEVVNEVYELFLDLDADESQIEFPIVYCNAQAGRAGLRPVRRARSTTSSRSSSCCSSTFPRPRTRRATRSRRSSRTSTRRRTSAGSRSAASSTARSARASRSRGAAPTATIERAKVTELYVTEALDRVDADEAGPGEIIAVAGLPEVTIGETLADPDDPRPLPVDHRRRAEPLDDDRDQHVAARRPGGRQG